MSAPVDDDDDAAAADPVILELTDELDLHTFAPGDVKELVADYLDACAERGFTEVRIIHGKGVGTLRRTVHAVLERHPAVASFTGAPERRGGWGATVVTLRSAVK
ncbi:MAG: Smr/MutS family protein [Deltaproteobacteria bacterium]|nr:Smr/MutS family protein [Deltaproteobacteria bacterium]